MKTIIAVLFVSFFSTGVFAQTEEQAIKKVLEQETTAFYKHDFKTSYTLWHVVPQSTGIVSSLDGNVLYLTNNELNEPYTAKELKSMVFPDTFERSGWKLLINTSSAYVSFDQTTLKGEEITGQTHETRYMEKIAGQWKIISMTVVSYKK